jgi:hypothetical protein
MGNATQRYLRLTQASRHHTYIEAIKTTCFLFKKTKVIHLLIMMSKLFFFILRNHRVYYSVSPIVITMLHMMVSNKPNWL